MIPKNKFELIDKLILLLVAVFALLFCSTLKGQERYAVKKVQNAYIIDFTDEFSGDSWNIDGTKIQSYGKLILTKKEYKTLIKDIKSIIDLTSKEIDRDNYSVLKYSWIRDSVWVYNNFKAFGVTKSDLKILNKKL
jgi:hypothetical protein